MEGYTAGVAVIIKNSWVEHIVDIEPLGDRAMYIIIKATMEITTIVAHTPQAIRPEEEREKVYELIEGAIRKRKGKGPVIVMGDVNARVQKARTKGVHGLHFM